MSKCLECNHDFSVTEQDQVFLQKLKVPDPNFCPNCRRKRRLAFWPFGIFQKRKCDFSGETIVSTLPPKAHFPVYKNEHWFSDQWSPPEQEIDWERSFFDQLYELQCKTPHFHQLGKNMVNCDYTDDTWDCKNVYLSRSLAGDEDLCHCYRVLNSRSSIDLTYSFDMEQSYECTYCFKCYNLHFSLNCQNCSDSYFLYDCRGVRNSFMCWNLRNKEYYILNKPYTKEQYEAKIKSFQLDSRKALEEFGKEYLEHLKSDAFHRIDFNNNVENSTGNYMSNCKNCHESYFTEDSEDCLYVMRNVKIKTSMDNSGIYRSELCYQSSQCTDVNNVKFANFCTDCYDSQYVDQCFNSHNLFGCVGLKRKEFCILNKQYSKEDYEKLVPRLIEKMKNEGEYGQFFPYKFAYNGFNLSLAAIYYVETEDSIKAKGGFFEEPELSSQKGIDGSTLPDTSKEISDDIVGKAINCARTGRVYNFIKQELEFYKKHHLPLPAYHPEIRNQERFLPLTNIIPRQIDCAQCQKKITTYYPEKLGYKNILCEDCYLKTVY